MDIIFWLLIFISPFLLANILTFIIDLFDHKYFESIENWKGCSCLKCRIEKHKYKKEEKKMEIEMKEKAALKDCCICEGSCSGEFIIVGNKKYHLSCIEKMVEEKQKKIKRMEDVSMKLFLINDRYYVVAMNYYEAESLYKEYFEIYDDDKIFKIEMVDDTVITQRQQDK